MNFCPLKNVGWDFFCDFQTPWFHDDCCIIDSVGAAGGARRRPEASLCHVFGTHLGTSIKSKHEFSHSVRRQVQFRQRMKTGWAKDNICAKYFNFTKSVEKIVLVLSHVSLDLISKSKIVKFFHSQSSTLHFPYSFVSDRNVVHGPR